MINTYFKFIALSDDVKAANKIRSKKRLDCVLFTDKVNYNGLTNFVNDKGQLFLYKTECNNFINADKKRMAEWSLTGNELNLSSIYIDDADFIEYGYGYPNPNRTLGNGKPNPLFEFRNDGYLFIMNNDYSEIEILIVKDGRNLISSYYHKLIDGGFDSLISEFRKQSIPFYNYLNNRL
jgi:hypothetical protein